MARIKITMARKPDSDGTYPIHLDRGGYRNTKLGYVWKLTKGSSYIGWLTFAPGRAEGDTREEVRAALSDLALDALIKLGEEARAQKERGR